MYTEPFQFELSDKLLDSERMELLSEMFRQSESRDIKNESYGGYKIYNTGKVTFWSYLPDLTHIVVDWLKIKQLEGKLTITKPAYAAKG
ncbi:MAG: hypothetical protein ABW076_11725 [Candidatus Thiodiazotropha sp.]